MTIVRFHFKIPFLVTLPCDNIALEAVTRQLSSQASTSEEPKGISFKQRVWQNSAFHPKFTRNSDGLLPLTA